MAAPSNTVLLNITDSIAKAVLDFQTMITLSAVTTPIGNINTGVGGTGASATLGRVLALGATPSFDPVSEIALAGPANTMVANVAAYQTGIQSLNNFYQSFLGFMNAFDAYINANITTGGVNAWLVANGLFVNTYFAQAFNYYVTNATLLGLRTSANAPVVIPIANYFPAAAVNPMFTFAVTGATTGTSTPGSATSTQGGGVAPLSMWKTNATTGVGGATYTITYVNAAGATASLAFNPGTLAGSSTLGAGSVAVGISPQSITSITVTGGTNAETYAFGEALVRAAAY